MALSIIELIVYGLFAYSSMLVLITSINKDTPQTRSSSILRSIYLIPGIICAAILASSGENIGTVSTNNTIINLNTTETWTETTLQTVVLQNEVWIFVHFMIMLVLIAYVIQQAITLIVKP